MKPPIAYIMSNWFYYLGVKYVNNELVYLLNFYDTHVVEELISKQATEYQPQAIIKYLQARLEWISAANNGHNENLPVEAIENTNGDPRQILCIYLFFNYFYQFDQFVLN